MVRVSRAASRSPAAVPTASHTRDARFASQARAVLTAFADDDSSDIPGIRLNPMQFHTGGENSLAVLQPSAARFRPASTTAKPQTQPTHQTKHNTTPPRGYGKSPLHSEKMR